MPSIADVNVLLPLLVDGHSHRRPALTWWEELAEDDVALCLPVRMGVLRLLCNRRIMGSSVQSPEAAWDAMQQLSDDPRISECEDIPAGHSAFWHANIIGREPNPNLWTDAWLAALAQSLDLELVTFDRGFIAFAGLRLKLLE